MLLNVVIKMYKGHLTYKKVIIFIFSFNEFVLQEYVVTLIVKTLKTNYKFF